MKEYIAEYIVPVEKKGNDCMFDFMNAKRLIRCKDCKVNGLCALSHTELAGEGYCAWAEPKD